MKWKDNASTVCVFHFDVAALPADFDETEALERRDHLPAGKERKLQSESETIS